MRIIFTTFNIEIQQFLLKAHPGSVMVTTLERDRRKARIDDSHIKGNLDGVRDSLR